MSWSPILAGREVAGCPPQREATAGTYAPVHKRTMNNPLTQLKERIAQPHQTRQSHSSNTSIDPHDVIDILASKRRRYAIEFLASQPPNDTIRLLDIVEYVATREYDCTSGELSSQQRQRVYVSLYQQHSGVLRSIVEYDDDRTKIIPTETPAHIWNAYCAFRNSLNG